MFKRPGKQRSQNPEGEPPGEPGYLEKLLEGVAGRAGGAQVVVEPCWTVNEETIRAHLQRRGNGFYIGKTPVRIGETRMQDLLSIGYEGPDGWQVQSHHIPDPRAGISSDELRTYQRLRAARWVPSIAVEGVKRARTLSSPEREVYLTLAEDGTSPRDAERLARVV